MAPTTLTPVNPHIDHNRYIWSDEYSGQYESVPYDQQFDDQWRLFLEKKIGFHRHNGVDTADVYINERIRELTGVANFIPVSEEEKAHHLDVGGNLFLEPKFPIDFFQDKRVLDAGCGAGRWTRTFKTLGASVTSIDVSPHGLESTRRYNDDVRAISLFDILKKHPELHAAYDFTLCWGVVMCTHDPALAFRNVAATVRSGGALYAMVYQPTLHSSPFVTENRRKYRQLTGGFEEKLQFAYSISNKPENAINLLDMLNTFYNWTIPEEVITNWFHQAGFSRVIMLNRHEAHACGWHMLGYKD